MSLQTRLLFVLLFFIFSFAIHLRAALDIDDLKRRALQYQGSSKINTDKLPANLKDVAATPTGRTIESFDRELSETDQRYVAVHMKLANRHFSKKDYTKANAELDLVFSRDPANAGARFMLAVISARLKKHDLAWYNILIAKEQDSKNDKIDNFITKLKTIMPQPTSPLWVKNVYRSMPISACEKYADIIENLLKTQVSQNITEITFGEYRVQGSKIILPIKFVFSTMPATVLDFSQAIKNASNVVLTGESVDDKAISYHFEISDLPLENPTASPVTDLKEFIKGVNEDVDVAIGDFEEYEPKNGIMRVNYKISVRNFSILNDFLRAVSPYTQKFFLTNMTLSLVTGSSTTIWKTDTSVYFLIEK